jgi:hypothetical protein
MVLHYYLNTLFDHYYKQKIIFKFIENSMYLAYIIDYIHSFFDESKKVFFT